MRYFSVKEIADLFGVSQETVRRWTRRTEDECPLKSVTGAKKLGTQISEEALKEFLSYEKNRIYSTQIVESEAKKLGLADLIGAIFDGVAGAAGAVGGVIGGAVAGAAGAVGNLMKGRKAKPSKTDIEKLKEELEDLKVMRKQFDEKIDELNKTLENLKSE